MRINAYLARAGVASRRGADELIKAGKVTINGELAGLNSRVGGSEEVRLDGKPIQAHKLKYILLNKPPAVVTTLNDPEGRKTVTELINITERIVPVGRLDYDTTGVLILTNDGELTHRLMHPSYGVDKTYQAEVAGEITPKILNMLSIGVRLSDGMTAPAKARKISRRKIELVIHEGRNHQVKRMLEAVGLPVKFLHRTRYDGISVDGLKLGQWRELTDEEITALKMVQ